MNQMTTRVKTTQLGQSHLIPALGELLLNGRTASSLFSINQTGVGNLFFLLIAGESWGHASTIRVVLYWEDNQRYRLLCHELYSIK